MVLLPYLFVLLAWQSATAVKKHSLLDELSPSIIAELRQLENDYGIQLASVGPGFQPDNRRNVFMGEPIDKGMLRVFIPVFLKEWQHYPKNLILKTGLKRVLLCQNLTVNGIPQDAAPDVEKKTIYFCLMAPTSTYPLEHLVRFYHEAIHHELFHYVDYHLAEDIHVDAAWSTLNAKGFSYGRSGLDNFYEQATTNVTSRFPGFISRYSQLNVAEDKAEIFSRMMLNLHEMECRARDDEILGKKMDRLKSVLKGFSPEMDDQFWEKMRYLDRPRLTLKGKEDPWADAHPTLPALPRLVEPVGIESNCHPGKRRLLLHLRLRRSCR